MEQNIINIQEENNKKPDNTVRVVFQNHGKCAKHIMTTGLQQKHLEVQELYSNSYVFRVAMLELNVLQEVVLNSTYIWYTTLLELPKKIRLTLTILGHSVSSLSHCKCASKINIETNSRNSRIRAKYHDINLYYVVLYTTHLSLMFRDVFLNYYIRAYDGVYYKHKAESSWILLDFHCLTRSIHEV